jgi:glutamate formiminotransferase
MPLLAIPNVSEGRRGPVIDALADATERAGGKIIDTHVDPVHNRTVFTVVGDIPASMSALAEAASAHIDLRVHSGVHPRIGALDVCPVVPHEAPMHQAIEIAARTAEEIARRANIPVFLYADAARRAETQNLADLRRGGLATLEARMSGPLPPDFGPAHLDPSVGVTCVGARAPLIAFNVWLRAELEAARSIARRVRTAGGGPPGVRALGLPIRPGVTQVSMNLVSPRETGIDRAFEMVERTARNEGAEVVATEIVGLLEARFLPDPEKQAARLLMRPGRSIETSLPS